MLAVLSTVLALVPAGFTENATLNARAAYVAGKPVHAYCTNDGTAWQNFVTSSGDTMPAGETFGVTPTVGGTETYLAPQTCAPIRARMRGRKPSSLAALGGALDILTHEAIHLRGSSDEGQTECAAIRTLPAFLVARWGFRKNSPAFREVMRGARLYHDQLPAEYRSDC